MFLDLKTLLSVSMTEKGFDNIFKSVFESLKNHVVIFEKHFERFFFFLKNILKFVGYS